MSDPRPCILIVDDEPSNRELFSEILSPEYRTIEASNGIEALAVLDRENVDLVLLDVTMPGASGYEVCQQIKARPTEVFLPVLMTTALADLESRSQGLRAGADDYLTKPINYRELRLQVRAFLRIRQQELLIRQQRE
jgi:DNA-binding response OmpR family regulator